MEKLRQAKIIKRVINPGFEIRDFDKFIGRVGVLSPTLDHKLNKKGLDYATSSHDYGKLTVQGKLHASKNLEADVLKHSGTPGQCYIYAKDAGAYMDCGHDGQWSHGKSGLWFSHIG